MRACVLDASVAVKWYVREELETQAQWVKDHVEECLVPDIFFAEASSVLWKKVRRGQLPMELAVRSLGEILTEPVFLGRETRALIPRAFDMAVEHGWAVYDCLYVLLALDTALPFVTADRKLYDRFAPSPPGRSLVWLGDLG